MAKTLLLIGAGHAHMTVLAELRAYTELGYRVILVSPDPYHYYSGMGPGMLGGTYRPQEIRFHVKKMVEDRGGHFLQQRVVRIDATQHQAVLADGQKIDYDVASCNTGSRVQLPEDTDSEHVTCVKPIAGLAQLQQRILNDYIGRESLFAVIGGGPAGVEVAGNLHQFFSENGVSARIALMAGRHGVLPDFPASLRQRAVEVLKERQIDLVEEGRVTSLKDRTAWFESGESRPFDHAILATGVSPSLLYKDSGLSVGPTNGLAVNKFLQSVDSPALFGGGDCIHFSPQPLAPVGVYAVRQNPILHHNLLAALEGRSLKRFSPQGSYLLILNLGYGIGLLKKGPVVIEGKRAFAAKDWIDRRFMKTFQTSGELDETS